MVIDGRFGWPYLSKCTFQVVPLIQKAYEQLACLGRTAGHFINHPSNTSNDNNTSARKAAVVQGPGDTLVEMSELAKDTWMEDGEPVVLPHPGLHCLFFLCLYLHCNCLTRWGLVMFKCQWAESSLVKVMACCLFCIKSLPELMVVYCQVNLLE